MKQPVELQSIPEAYMPTYELRQAIRMLDMLVLEDYEDVDLEGFAELHDALQGALSEYLLRGTEEFPGNSYLDGYVAVSIHLITAIQYIMNPQWKEEFDVPEFVS